MKRRPQSSAKENDVLDGFEAEASLPAKRKRRKKRRDPLTLFEAEQPSSDANSVGLAESTRLLDLPLGNGEADQPSTDADSVELAESIHVLDLAPLSDGTSDEVELAPLVEATLVPRAHRHRFNDSWKRFAPHVAIGLLATATLVVVALPRQDLVTGGGTPPPENAVVTLSEPALDELAALAAPIDAVRAFTPPESEAAAEEEPSSQPPRSRGGDAGSRRPETSTRPPAVAVAASSRPAVVPPVVVPPVVVPAVSLPVPADPPNLASREPVRVATTPPPATTPSPSAPLPATPPRPAPLAEPVPPAPAEAVDARAIQLVLGRYRNAFNVLDSGAAKAVWPSVDARALSRAFDRLEEQAVQFSECNIAVTGVRATASCAGSAKYVPKVGNRSPHYEPRQWKFNLRKVDEGWLIDQVDSR
jgi:hypothetical protein